MSEINLIEPKRRGRFFRYAPLVLWVGLIFFLSSGQGAATQTSRFIRPLLEFLFPGAADETLAIYHGYIRKSAHFAEYAALAFWSARTFWTSSITVLRKLWQLAAFAFVFSIAAIDEYNQSFNSLRTSSIYDVLLDASGGLVMIFILTLYRKNH